MVKYFCDECEIEVINPSSSLDMTGKVLCSKHFVEYEKRGGVSYSITWDENMNTTRIVDE